MFTGIIEEIGKIQKIEDSGNVKIFQIQCSKILKGKKNGGSIAVNGACMTIIKIQKDSFNFQTLNETLKKTNLSKVKKGDSVNLESPLTLNKAIDGHLTLGHIDDMGQVCRIKEKNDDLILTVKMPDPLKKYLALKGSIAINGVSLTISHLEESTFNVDLIKHTKKSTNLGNLKPKDFVNLEVDLIARYLKRLLDNKEKETTYEFLKERNFI